MHIDVLRRFVGTATLLAMLASLTGMAEAQRLTAYVTDQTGTLLPTEVESLNSELATFERETSTQIIVLIVPTIGNGSLEEASLRVAEENGIGQKGKNNGALLYIAKNDRKLRIEVGYGLEGVLTDAMSNLIIRREIAPQFKAGRYYEGVRAGVAAIMLASKDEYKGDPRKSAPGGTNLLPLIIIAIAFIFLSRLRRNRFLGGGVPPIFFGGGGSGGSSGGFGGGFSGGGGSFGGGGSSGSW
jgi:uncharacterized protein